MNEVSVDSMAERSSAIAHWQLMLRDDVALLAMPGAHHKALVRQAYALHHCKVIDADDLIDLLEFADAALGFAIEAMLDVKPNE